MDWELIWSEQALTDLLVLIGERARRDPATADRLRVSIFTEVERLRRSPDLHSRYPRGNSQPTHELRCGHCRIFYDVVDLRRQVQILRIWHEAPGDPSR